MEQDLKKEKSNLKKIILGSFLGILIGSILGTTYAMFTYNSLSTNNKLIAGDIYMRYKENNQLFLENVMPMNMNGYYVNPNMSESILNSCASYAANHNLRLNSNLSAEEKNECVTYVSSHLLSQYSLNSNMTEEELQKCSTFISSIGFPGDATVYCRGENTDYGNFQSSLSSFPEEFITYFIDNNIIFSDTNSSVENFCLGTGKINNKTFEESIYSEFSNDDILFFKSKNIINSINNSLDTYKDYCSGTSQINNKTFSEDYARGLYISDNETLLNEKIILPNSTKLQYFEFQIIGKNTTTNKDIEYDISLNYGDTAENKTEENRILDKFLRFTLVSVENNEETVILTNQQYRNLNNRKIYVSRIPKNTISDINKIYRLYMWIDNSVVIGNKNQDYTIEEWNNLFASVKVNVEGKFVLDSTSEHCFTTSDNNNTVTITGFIKDVYQRNLNMTSTEFQSCVDYFTNTKPISGDPTAFCQGTGKYGIDSSNYTYPYFDQILDYFSNDINSITWGFQFFSTDELNDLKDLNVITITAAPNECKNIRNLVIPSTIEGKKVTTIDYEAFSNSNLTSVVIPNSVTDIKSFAFAKNQLTSIEIPDSVTTIGSSAFYNNQLTSVYIPDSVTTIENGAFESNQLTSVKIPNSVTTLKGGAFERNQLTNVEIPSSITVIAAATFAINQLTSVKIPNSITTIEFEAFRDNRLTSVEIPNSVTTIDYDAFSSNFLTSIEIPNSVTTIGFGAFSGNQLTNVTIGNGITAIGESAFLKSNNSYESRGITYYNNPNLTSIRINKSCSDIKNNLLSYGNNKYPWLHYSSPYIGIGGVTIYGSNNEVCDTF